MKVRLIFSMVLVALGALGSAYALSRPTSVEPVLQSLKWTVKSAWLEAATTQPAQCASTPQSELDTGQIALGHALFNTPNILGGQAARAGLSCASCHVNGRDNPHFFLAGVSSKPGTADVTGSFFGLGRSNGQFDPVPIPDLAKPGKVDRAETSPALKAFIRTLIVEEFAGAKPSDVTLNALLAYVRSVGACEGEQRDAAPRRAPIQMVDHTNLVQDALASAEAATLKNDISLAKTMIVSARHHLGLLDERLSVPGAASTQRALTGFSRELAGIDFSTGSPHRIAPKLAAAQQKFDRRLVPELARLDSVSRYNPAIMAHSLAVSDAKR